MPDMNELPSGLLVPVEKSEPKPWTPPARRFGPLELQDPERREAAKVALVALWDACGMKYSGSGIVFADIHPEAHRAAWRYIAEMLLGPDIPEQEIYC